MPASLITVHAELEELEPPVTRDLQIDGSSTLADLHHALQIAFGWRDVHAHLFRDRDRHDPTAAHWGDPHRLTGRDFVALRPESTTTVADALAGGTLWYDYDFGDGWCHRLTAGAPTTAIGTTRPVTLIGGSRRGPIEDSGGPAGYTEKLAVLDDPDHPDHDRIADWAAEVTGPWFPPTPESFDAEAIQAELDGFFGFGADERDPHDVSGLVAADDLRGPGDLSPESLLVDFAAGLPATLRSEFRRYARRTGLLEPVEVDPEVQARLLAPFAWLLDAVGPDGIALSEAGRLPPAVVLDGMTTLGRHDSRLGASTRERSTVPIRALHEATVRLGLVRVLEGRLVRTAHGARAAAGPEHLWDALTARLLTKLSPGAQVAATALLLSHADGRAQPGAGRPDSRWREVAFALEACGWAPGDRSGEFDRCAVAEIVRPVQNVLDSLGSTRGDAGWPRPAEPEPHVADFARAALHGTAALRSGTASRYRR
ncbi:plasmid pRiA4b ORF-3 family protein [Gordonia sp. (in: high G+C Gram-positive bacteria)]|uniref:plasmid pRiA4b ORF-3 family protein n=1 Tax=Gordonia sp. (in: high G+C Gram-positive bacteria) TaxID=84139 RepID=UPI003528DB29